MATIKKALKDSSYFSSNGLMGLVKLMVSMVISTLRTLPKKSVMRTLPGSLRNRSVRWPGVDTHWLLGHTLNWGNKERNKKLGAPFAHQNLNKYSIYVDKYGKYPLVVLSGILAVQC